MKKTFLAILFIFFTTFSFALEIGDKAPNFKVELSDGKQVSLSDYKGKYLFYIFGQLGAVLAEKNFQNYNSFTKAFHLHQTFSFWQFVFLTQKKAWILL